LLSSLVLSSSLSLFNAPSTSYIYTLSLHDALPISNNYPNTDGDDLPDFIPTSTSGAPLRTSTLLLIGLAVVTGIIGLVAGMFLRSEEHTSELQSRFDLVCRLLLEKKNRKSNNSLLK